MARGHIDINEHYCKGCDYCVRFCARGCITQPGDRFSPQGYLLPVFSAPSRCNACGVCAWMCPDQAIEVFRYIGPKGRPGPRVVQRLLVQGNEAAGWGALATGDSQAANLVLLGACVQATGVLPPSLLVSQLEKRFARSEKLKGNIAAFQEGLKQGEDRNRTEEVAHGLGNEEPPCPFSAA